ncbi:hypothetical protein [Arsenicibacter rosenii]|uniref:Uncharacterized protein n=1 Tax=Arsenicibacter rosenii TaxID=1750698 RepID=A0A1S2VM03_9BACT|nr:hypothetical protein [Arsenicibacter rosenii]OIN59779.1 hypothetical protein BLX24_07945 [Arsenicibacter rosenii]
MAEQTEKPTITGICNQLYRLRDDLLLLRLSEGPRPQGWTDLHNNALEEKLSEIDNLINQLYQIGSQPEITATLEQTTDEPKLVLHDIDLWQVKPDGTLYNGFCNRAGVDLEQETFAPDIRLIQKTDSLRRQISRLIDDPVFGNRLNYPDLQALFRSHWEEIMRCPDRVRQDQLCTQLRNLIDHTGDLAKSVMTVTIQDVKLFR